MTASARTTRFSTSTKDTQKNNLELYLVACLLAFFQQQRLYAEQEPSFRPFNIEKPLWIFVGGSVTKTLASPDASDIVEILRSCRAMSRIGPGASSGLSAS